MRVLITGGAGFIGQHLAVELVRRGCNTVALDSLVPRIHIDPQKARDLFPGTVIAADIRDSDAVAAAAKDCDSIVHLAAETSAAQSMAAAELYEHVNVYGTQVVATQAARLGIPFFLASSRAVYGEGAWLCHEHGRKVGIRCCIEAIPAASLESDELAPVSIYGNTKVAAELILRELHPPGIKWLVFRPQNVVGPGQAPHNPYTGVLAAFAARLRANLPPQVYGDGTQSRDFIDVRDVARTITALLLSTDIADRSGTEITTVNIGSGQRATLKQLAKIAIDAVESKLNPQLVAIKRSGDIEHACADLGRYNALGLPAPTYRLADSVAAFITSAWSHSPVDPKIWEYAVSQKQAVEQ